MAKKGVQSAQGKGSNGKGNKPATGAEKQTGRAEKGASLLRGKGRKEPRAAAPAAPPAGNEDEALTPEEQDQADRIAARAYQIYQERGGEHGADLDDWLRAERELSGEG